MDRNWLKVLFTPLYLLLLIIILFLLLILWIFPWPNRWFCGWLEKLLAIIKGILKKLKSWISQLCYPADTATHIITASKTGDGTISPEGDIPVDHGQSATFTLLPDPNHHLSEIWVDANSVALPTTDQYPSPPVTGDMTIEAFFAIDQHTITASSNGNGSISPDGDSLVGHGEPKVYIIIPDENHCVLNIEIDGVTELFDSAGGDYTFDTVVSNRTIKVNFVKCIVLICPTTMVFGAPSSGGFSNQAQISATSLVGDPLTGGNLSWTTSPHLNLDSNTIPQPTATTNQITAPGPDAWIRLTYTAANSRVITAECSFPILQA